MENKDIWVWIHDSAKKFHKAIPSPTRNGVDLSMPSLVLVRTFGNVREDEKFDLFPPWGNDF